jgi:hypothetical protein
MVEYGEGVGQGTGAGTPIGVGRGGGSQDLGSGASAFIQDTIDTMAALPPEQLLLLVVVVAFLGLLVLRRAL